MKILYSVDKKTIIYIYFVNSQLAIEFSLVCGEPFTCNVKTNKNAFAEQLLITSLTTLSISVCCAQFFHDSLRKFAVLSVLQLLAKFSHVEYTFSIKIGF